MSKPENVTTVTRVMGTCPSCNEELRGEIDLVAKTEAPFLTPEGHPKVRSEAYRCGMRIAHECGPSDVPRSFADLIGELFGQRTPEPETKPVAEPATEPERRAS